MTKRSLSAWGAVVAAALCLALLPGTAVADHARAFDPDDTHGRLDIRRVSHGHRGAHVLTHRITTFGEWRPRLLSKRTYLTVWFSTDGDKWAEYIARIFYRHGGLRACFGGYAEGSDYAGVGPCKRVPVARPDRRSVLIRLKDSFVGDDDSYGWSAESSYALEGSEHCPLRNVCYDYVPSRLPRGGITHQL
jgi:hypothetical protein